MCLWLGGTGGSRLVFQRSTSASEFSLRGGVGRDFEGRAHCRQLFDGGSEAGVLSLKLGGTLCIVSLRLVSTCLCLPECGRRQRVCLLVKLLDYQLANLIL